MHVSETAQLQELIDFYRSKLLLANDRYYTDDACNQFLMSMLQLLIKCQQYSVSQYRISPPAYGDEHYFRWLITFFLFPAAFDCIENSLHRLLHECATGCTLPFRTHLLGKHYKILAEYIHVGQEHTRSFDLLDTMKSRLTRQQDSLSNSGTMALTTYCNQPYVSTYGYTVELTNPLLLFAILKNVGNLFSELFLEIRKPPAKYLTTRSKCQSSAWS